MWSCNKIVLCRPQTLNLFFRSLPLRNSQLHRNLQLLTPGFMNESPQYMLKQHPADWYPAINTNTNTNTNVNQFIANFAEETIDNNKWFRDLLNNLNTPINETSMVHKPDPQRPSQWVSHIPVRGQSNWFKMPWLNLWGSVPLGAEASFSHNCNSLNCSICGQANFGMECRKRKYHSGPPVNETWSGDGALMASRNPKYPLEPLNNESWVGNDSIMDVLTNTYLPFDQLPPLEQLPVNSENALGSDANNKIAEDAIGNRPDGNDKSSQLGPDVPSGTLMNVYNSFMKYSASTQDALSPKVNKVPTEMRSEEVVICGLNSALYDFMAVLETMQSMEPSVLESDKKSSTALTDSFEDNRSELGSRNSNKQNASLADSLTASQIKEHLSTFIQPEKDISRNTTLLASQNYKLLLAPTPVYCSSCDLLIKKNGKYYRSTDENFKHCICMGCFRGSCGSNIVTQGGSVVKASLDMAKNDEEIEDSRVLCVTCQQWQHGICGLYNNETDLEGKSEYVCPKCCLKEIENGTRVSLPKNFVGAKDLPQTNLSDHIEQRLFTRMKQEREETAKFHGIELEKVPVAEGLVVRVVVSVDKELEVKKQFRDIFHGHDYPEKIKYRSKLILLFQKIEGVDICIFGIYVQEFGSDCNGPNNRCVYISYIDSVKYFQPERKTASGEPLRTFVYHEILIGYLEHCKKRGFTSCYIWACPLTRGNDYIFYRHPKTQKTPKKTKLRQWYKLMIMKAVKSGIVVDHTNLFNEFFIPTSNKISASRLPYFDGDYWSYEAQDISENIGEQESFEGRLCIKEESSEGRSCVKSRPNSQEMPTKDDLVMHKLGDIILPEKESYMILRLQHTCTSCKETILSGSRWFCMQCNKIQLCSRCFSEGKMSSRCGSCKKTQLSEDVLSTVPVDTKDNDDVLINNFFQASSDFWIKCQDSLYQFHTLGHAKYSSMMILHHFKQSMVVQPNIRSISA